MNESKQQDSRDIQVALGAVVLFGFWWIATHADAFWAWLGALLSGG